MTPTSDPRTFLGWDAPALPAAAALLADAYAQGDALAADGVVVALPGARAGRRLKELLVAEAERRRLRLVPPQVTTVGALPELLYSPAEPLADAQLARRVWLRQLRALAAAELAVLFPHLPPPTDLRRWFALADEVSQLHGLVGAAGRRFEDVAAACEAGLLYDDSVRWRVLARVQAGYAETLASLGRTDRDLARLAALEAPPAALDCAVWVVGVAEMPAVLRSLLARARPLELRVLVHAPSSLAHVFDELGCVRPQAWLAADVPLRDDQLEIVGHPSNQAVAAVRALSALGGAFAADEIVIGVPDPEVVPYLEQQLATAGVGARYAGGLPLERTSPFRLLSALADVLRDGSAESVAALARHPAFGEWLRRRRWQVPHPGAAAFRESDGWLMQLDAFLCERLPPSVTTELGGAGGRGRSVVEALRAALLSDALLGGLAGTRPLAQWLPRVLELMLELYGEGARSRDVPAERRLLGVAQALRNAAVAHARVPAELDEACDVATAIGVLLDELRGEPLPPEADDAAIELLGWLELHLDDSPMAVLTGMNEPFVPEAINAHAFLPNALRARLGIEDNDRRYARDAYQFTAMLHSRRVHAVAGRRTLLGDPQRPSRLLLATSGEPLARRVRAFLAADDSPLRAASGAAGGATRFRLPPERVITLPSVPDSFRVTELGDLLCDPYGWALDRVMDGDVVDDSARELDPLRFGSLAHAVLERFGRSVAAASHDEAAIAAYLDQELDALVAAQFGATLPAVRLQVEQLRLRLRAFARAQAAWLLDGWQTVAVECGTPEGGVPFDVDGEPVRLRGRIDRIDWHAGRREWAVFDYKTGERGEGPDEVHRKKDAWLSLQLPLYRELLPHVVDGDARPVCVHAPDAAVRLGFILLCGDPGQCRIELAEWTAAELEHAREAAREAVRTARANCFVFPGLDSDWLSDDMAALLGRGRLVVEDEELELEVLS